MIPGATAHIIDPAIAAVGHAIARDLVGRGGFTLFAASTPAGRARIQELAAIGSKDPAPTPPTYHLLHAGLYVRSLMIPAGHVLTGVRIRIPTVLVLEGDCTVTGGDDVRRLSGFHVIAGAADRQQAYEAHIDTFLAMMFATSARTVEDAEREFTDEADRLFSRHGVNVVHTTGG